MHAMTGLFMVGSGISYTRSVSMKRIVSLALLMAVMSPACAHDHHALGLLPFAPETEWGGLTLLGSGLIAIAVLLRKLRRRPP